MPEAGYIPIPRKLARAGVKDIVRISDGRMSGTAFGTIVLHVTPESAIGGPLAHVQQRRPHPPVGGAARDQPAGVRRRAGAARAGAAGACRRRAERGYRKLFLASVTQADKGVDFDFLPRRRSREGCPGPERVTSLRRHRQEKSAAPIARCGARDAGLAADVS